MGAVTRRLSRGSNAACLGVAGAQGLPCLQAIDSSFYGLGAQRAPEKACRKSSRQISNGVLEPMVSKLKSLKFATEASTASHM